MKLEELTEDSVKQMTDSEIKKFKDRVRQLYIKTEEWKETIEKSLIGVKDPIDHEVFYQKYRIIFNEIEKRNLDTTPIDSLDIDMARLSIQGIDKAHHVPILLEEDVVLIGGDFAKNHKNSEAVNICNTIDIDEDNMEMLTEQFKKITNKEVEIEDELHNDEIVIPMYDLVLWPKNNPSFQKMECSEEKETKEEDESIIIDFDKSNKESFVKSEDQRLIGGIVYSVNEPDHDGDYVETEEEIWNALESFAVRGNVIKFMHRGKRRDVTVVESFQSEADTKKANQIIPKGSWYMTVKVHDDNLWNDVKEGHITGFSMSGMAESRIKV